MNGVLSLNICLRFGGGNEKKKGKKKANEKSKQVAQHHSSLVFSFHPSLGGVLITRKMRSSINRGSKEWGKDLRLFCRGDGGVACSRAASV